MSIESVLHLMVAGVGVPSCSLFVLRGPDLGSAAAVGDDRGWFGRAIGVRIRSPHLITPLS
ncbi:hypothetical protein [Kibdelosporangium philippinense]|uniref:hypothetical protein n=1 Tax=Kibdelosporangium philippinense TaxID=211113 RepID=UPI00360EB293